MAFELFQQAGTVLLAIGFIDHWFIAGQNNIESRNLIPFIDNLGLAGHHPFNFPAQLLNGADIDFLIPDNDKITDSAGDAANLLI